MVYNVYRVMHRVQKTTYLTVNDVAKLLGISTHTVRLWTKKGVLRAKRHPINRYRLYVEEDVQKLIKTIKEKM